MRCLSLEPVSQVRADDRFTLENTRDKSKACVNIEGLTAQHWPRLNAGTVAIAKVAHLPNGVRLPA